MRPFLGGFPTKIWYQFLISPTHIFTVIRFPFFSFDRILISYRLGLNIEYLFILLDWNFDLKLKSKEIRLTKNEFTYFVFRIVSLLSAFSTTGRLIAMEMQPGEC
jgi:hypothetical protein